MFNKISLRGAVSTFLSLGVIVATVHFSMPSQAEDTSNSVGNTIDNGTDAVKTDAKKTKRAMKRTGRKIKGTDNAAKDTVDSMQDGVDDAKHEMKKK